MELENFLFQGVYFHAFLNNQRCCRYGVFLSIMLLEPNPDHNSLIPGNRKNLKEIVE